MIKTLLWDFDGTLFDTYPRIVKQTQSVMNDMGYHEIMSKENYDLMMSLAKVKLNHMREVIYGKFNLSEEKIKKANDEYYKREELSWPEGIYLYPYVKEVCSFMVENGGQNILYTHRQQNAITAMEKFDLAKYFTEFVTMEYAVERGFREKPYPDTISHIVERFGLNPDETMMVGDRDIDILAGTNAKIKTCFYKSYEHNREVEATLRVLSLEELLKYLKQ
ncbi:MAG: HAD-IA family hydrolase [Lachnospiraceae bacterium]|nr:HAD-IA family hydrolase [Lachnospiraceae bacterium]